MTQATEIYYDPDPKTTEIEEDREWVEGYFDLNEVGEGGHLDCYAPSRPVLFFGPCALWKL